LEVHSVFRLSQGENSVIPLDEAVKRFLLRYDNQKTVLSYRRVLDPFKFTLGPTFPLAAIGPEEIDIWNSDLRDHEPPLSPWTLASRRKRLKAFFNWCVERGYLTQSPARFLKVNQPRTRAGSKAIPDSILLAMLDAARQKTDLFTRARDSAVIGLIITFGARVGDVARLVLPHVAPDWIVFDVKGGAEHRLPMPPETGALLTRWLEIRHTLNPDPDHNHVFTNNRLTPGTRYGPLTVDSIATLFRRLSKEVSGQAYGPHSIRHWRGQSLFDDGVPPTVVQELLGHRSIETTLKFYANQDYDRLRRVLERTELGKQRRPPEGKSAKIIPFPCAS
jgi:integrase